MAAASKNKIEIILSAVDQSVTATIRKVRNGFAELGRTVQNVTTTIAPLTAAVSGVAGAIKLVEVTREFDKLSAGLITATGSAEGAKTAFSSIQDFAANTPYDLAQVTDSFIKLVNFGLTPSEQAMTSYGNTSSALGKDLNQMIEAVADAATGEFERLKEFGIKAKSEGDNVSFTFRGITTTVGKNAAEIENYLIALGETNFGTAMSERIKTLDGALSNLGDEWDKLFLNISQQGIGDAIADGVRVAITALQELSAMITSGELEATLTAYANRWKGWAADVNTSVELVRQAFSSSMDDIKQTGTDAVAWLTGAFKNFPENVRAFIGLMVVEFASTFDKLIIQAMAYKDSIKAIFTDDTIEGVEERKKQQLEAINTARNESIDVILKERDTALDAAAKETAAIKKLREEYDKKQKAKAEAAKGKDDLAQFRAAGGDGKKTQGTAEAEKAAGKNLTDAKKKEKELAEDEKRAAIRAAEHSRKVDPNSIYYNKEYAENYAAEQRRIAREKAAEEERKNPSVPQQQRQAPPPEKEQRATDEQIARAQKTRQTGESDKEALDRILNYDAAKEKKEEKEDKHKAKNKDGVIRRDAFGNTTARTRSKSSDQILTKKEIAAQKEVADAVKAITDESEAYRLKTIEEQTAAAKEAADKQTAAQKEGVGKMQSVFTAYAERVKKIQDEIAGREKSLADELADLDPHTTEEQRWRRKAKAAADYEKAAKAAMAAGRLDEARDYADQAKTTYAGLKGGSGNISDKRANRTAFSGVSSAGTLGLNITKMMTDAAAKAAKASISGIDGLNSQVYSRVSGQLQKAISSMASAAPTGPGKQAPVQVHELRLGKAKLQGSADDVADFVKQLELAGMRA